MSPVLPLQLAIQPQRLNHHLAELAQIGRLPEGGVRRIAYGPEDHLARQQVRQWMQTAGMQVTIDAAGNLIGTYPGRIPSLPALATGSHIDTVPSGGRYDGALGVLAGIEVVQTLQDHNMHLNHPIHVIVFTDEEGGMIGSKALSGGIYTDPEHYRRPDGTSIQTCLAQIGGNWEQIRSARRTRQDIAAFVELHVEQGGSLDQQGIPIGIVEGIVGMRRSRIQITGRPNHAGTTPMHLRQDALVAAAQVILTAHDLALQTAGDQVATVGMCQVWPNASNIVPGRVELSLDLRDLSAQHLDQLQNRFGQTLQAIETQSGCTVKWIPVLQVDPALAAPGIQQAIAAACTELGLSYRALPSRAGHDAQEMARFTDMGMIFVPSQGGISHAEDEYTSPDQCAYGADILLQTLMKLDKSY
ncbi:MAG: Zn-dependent hydrolase [Thermostichus sp. DG02_5_bins_236]